LRLSPILYHGLIEAMRATSLALYVVDYRIGVPAMFGFLRKMLFNRMMDNVTAIKMVTCLNLENALGVCVTEGFQRVPISSPAADSRSLG
jgi:hypothetical protein